MSTVIRFAWLPTLLLLVTVARFMPAISSDTPGGATRPTAPAPRHADLPMLLVIPPPYPIPNVDESLPPEDLPATF